MKSNIVGIKATAGLVPKDNIIVTKRRGSVGPMASTIKDAATLLTFMAGKSDSDYHTNQIPFETVPNYAASCDPSALRGSRIGIPRNGLRNPIGVNINTTAIINAFEEAVLLLIASGPTIIDNAN
jgi:amidase